MIRAWLSVLGAAVQNVLVCYQNIDAGAAGIARGRKPKATQSAVFAPSGSDLSATEQDIVLILIAPRRRLQQDWTRRLDDVRGDSVYVVRDSLGIRNVLYGSTPPKLCE